MTATDYVETLRMKFLATTRRVLRLLFCHWRELADKLRVLAIHNILLIQDTWRKFYVNCNMKDQHDNIKFQERCMFLETEQDNVFHNSASFPSCTFLPSN